MMGNKGISLIILIITVVIVIILVSGIVVSLLNNNLIVSANESNFKKNVQEYNSELAIALSNELLIDNKFDASTFNKGVWNGGSTSGTIKQYITSITEKDGKKFEIQNGKLVYVGMDQTEENWLAEIGMTSVEIPPVADTIIYPQLKSGLMYDDYGWMDLWLGGPNIYIGGDGHGSFSAYLSFDTLAIQSSITSAKIRMKALSFWEEGTLNMIAYTGTQPLWGDNFWVTQTENDWGCGTVPLGTQTVDTVDTWYEWNVPIEYINIGGETQFEIRCISEWDDITVTFGGVTSASKPELVITY